MKDCCIEDGLDVGVWYAVIFLIKGLLFYAYMVLKNADTGIWLYMYCICNFILRNYVINHYLTQLPKVNARHKCVLHTSTYTGYRV